MEGVVEKDIEWFEEKGFCNDKDVEFEKIYFINKDFHFSAKEFNNLDLSDSAIIIEGNLIVDGLFEVADFNFFYIEGDVKCKSFFACDDGYLECSNLIVEKYADCAMVSDIRTLDVGTLIAPIVLSFNNCSEIQSKVEAEFIIDDEIDNSNFEEIYKALKAG